MRRILLCLVIVFALSATTGYAGQEKSPALKDLQIIKKRVYDSYVQTGRRDVPELISSLQTQGSWKDINYKDTARQSMGRKVQHLYRVGDMAKAYKNPEHKLCQNKRLRKSIDSALDFWLAGDFKDSNWYWNEIGVTQALGEILLLMEEELSDAQMKAGIKVLMQAALDRYQKGHPRRTGQNLVWVADVMVVRGCIENDPRVVAGAFGAIAKTLDFTLEEGLQADYSFHQHGDILYSGGYGIGFAVDCPRFAVLASGTAFAFSPERIENMSGYILDGQQWMIRRQTFDYGAVGRTISRTGQNTTKLIEACRTMVKLGTSRQAEFEAFAERLEADMPKDYIKGNRHFWRSDFMVHHRNGYYTSVKMHSVRTAGSESGNNEGLQNYHLADGATYIFRTTDEYRDIFPVWDWRRIPGITCEQSRGPLPLIEWGRGAQGTTSFVGGVSDGTYGVAAYDFVKDKTSAKKAWFYFDDEFVCLGAGINCTGDNPVLTSVNQCHLKGDVAISDGRTETKVEKGQHLLKDVRWVHHDKTGYLFSGDAALTLKNEAETGSWQEIRLRSSKARISLDVFSLWLDHGTRPKNATYSYTVVPDIGLGRMREYASTPPVATLSNSSDLQAVQHKGLGLTGIAFYKAGTLETKTGLSISVNKPCLLMVHEKGNRIQISISNPENKPLTVAVDINRKLTGERCVWLEDKKLCRVSFGLPAGQQAGKSVVRILECAS